MNSVVAIALLAGLFVLFGAFVKARRGCPGAEVCEDAAQPEGCDGCDLYQPRETVESSDART